MHRQVTNNVSNDQLQRQLINVFGNKLVVKRVSWPRTKGPKAVRIDCKTGHAVQFVN